MLPQLPIIKPAIPFADDIINGLRVGNVISIHGSIPSSAQSFEINFASGPNIDGAYRSPIVFHFNPRFNQRYVARNSFVNNAWQTEESVSPFGEFPFARGEPFEILIVVNSHDYKVAVNNKHFISYCHRMPIEQVKMLHVLNDVIVDQILLTHEASPFSPPNHTPPASPVVFYNLHVPVEKYMAERLKVGKKIVISGHPISNCHRFTIDLLHDNNDIAFHLSVRFDEKCVVRNTRVRGSWNDEERQAFIFPLSPRRIFDIKITCEYDRYVVDVDGAHFCTFKHRLLCAQVSKIGIGGDVSITSLTIH